MEFKDFLKFFEIDGFNKPQLELIKTVKGNCLACSDFVYDKELKKLYFKENSLYRAISSSQEFYEYIIFLNRLVFYRNYTKRSK